MKRFLNSKLSKDKNKGESSSPPPGQTEPSQSGSPPPAQHNSTPLAPPVPNPNGAGFNPPAAVQLPPPPRVTDVAGAIGWSCAMPVLDTAYLLQLAEYCGTSSAVSKQASKALRAEFAHGAPQAQERAIRVLLVLMRNSDHRFREQVAAKKFTTELQELYNSKKTDDRTRATLLRVISAFAYDYQRDADLSALTQLYNKLKPAHAPINGEPLSPDDPLLALSSVPYHRHHSHRSSQPDSHRPSPQRLPTDAHSLAQLRSLARETQGAANLLTEAVAFAAPEADLAQDELLGEFIGKTSTSVAELAEQRAWVTSQAERKRDERREREELRAAEAASRAEAERHAADGGARQGSGDHSALASNNPYKRMFEGPPPTSDGNQAPAAPVAAEVEGETDEERTLALVLTASEAGQEALRLYEAHQERRQEAAELKEAEERSRLETRFDRSTAGTPDAQGAYHPAGQAGPGEGPSSGSHSHAIAGVSANPYAAHMSPAKAKRQSTDGSGYQSTPPRQQQPQAYDGARLIEFDSDGQPDYTASPLASPTGENGPTGAGGVESAYGGLAELGLGSPARAGRAERSGTVGSEVLQDPTEPSSKALGKLRRVSVREDSETDAEEKMRELEAKLRAKYERGGEEGQGA